MTNIPRTALCCVSAVAFTIAVSSTAFAQGMKMDKPMVGQTAGQMMQKTLDENAKVAVTDVVAKPGETSPLQSRPMRVGFVLSGGTFERTYADGKKERIVEKAGETKILDISKPYALKNIGKTTIHTVIVNLK
jgi:hypothetical protein